MSNGPIEFLGEQPVHDGPTTEFGGADGLIQKPNSVVLPGDPGASGGHDLLGDKRDAVAERAGVLRRGAAVLYGPDAWTGEDSADGEVVDPATGFGVKSSDLSDAGGAGAGELSQLKP